MGYSNVITPCIARGLKLLGLAIPLSTLALITVMVVQAYNEMTNFDFAGSVEFASTSVQVESGTLPNIENLER